MSKTREIKMLIDRVDETLMVLVLRARAHFITNKLQEEVKVNGGEEVSRVHLGWG